MMCSSVLLVFFSLLCISQWAELLVLVIYLYLSWTDLPLLFMYFVVWFSLGNVLCRRANLVTCRLIITDDFYVNLFLPFAFVTFNRFSSCLLLETWKNQLYTNQTKLPKDIKWKAHWTCCNNSILISFFFCFCFLQNAFSCAKINDSFKSLTRYTK